MLRWLTRPTVAHICRLCSRVCKFRWSASHCAVKVVRKGPLRQIRRKTGGYCHHRSQQLTENSCPFLSDLLIRLLVLTCPSTSICVLPNLLLFQFHPSRSNYQTLMGCCCTPAKSSLDAKRLINLSSLGRVQNEMSRGVTERDIYSMSDNHCTTSAVHFSYSLEII